MRYTLLEQDVLDSELPRCAERGVGIVIGGGYNSGILATGAVPGAMYNYEPARPGDPGAGGEDRGRLHAPWNVPLAGGGAPFPARASDRRLDHSGRDLDAHRSSRTSPHSATTIPADFWAELKHEKLIRADAPTPE